MPRALSHADEMSRILAAYGDRSFEPIMAMLERQFTVLHNRSQVVLTLCGIVISTTGFSGRLIAGTSPMAQLLVIVGVATVLLAAATVVLGVLHLRWLTQQLGADTAAWLDTTLRYRDRKTHFYRVGLVLLTLGLAFYVAAISLMLLHPTAAPLVNGR